MNTIIIILRKKNKLDQGKTTLIWEKQLCIKMRLVLKFKLANDNSLVRLQLLIGIYRRCSIFMFKKSSVYKQENGDCQFKVYKQPGKIYIGVELLHVTQIDNDVKSSYCKIFVYKTCVYFNHGQSQCYSATNMDINDSLFHSTALFMV